MRYWDGELIIFCISVFTLLLGTKNECTILSITLEKTISNERYWVDQMKMDDIIINSRTKFLYNKGCTFKTNFEKTKKVFENYEIINEKSVYQLDEIRKV